MKIRTALTLSQPQVSRMVAYARARLMAIEAERTDWIADREEYGRQWDSDFSARCSDSVVFSKSNESFNLVGSGVDFVHARLKTEIFGSKPFFSAEPVSQVGDDPALADQVRRHLEWKLGPGQIDFSGAGEALILKAGKLGEGVAKIAHRVDAEEYERIASILVDTKTGKPVIDHSGNFVFEDDGTEVLTSDRGMDVVPRLFPEVVLGTAVEGGVQLNGRYAWREQIVTEEEVRYSGAQVIPLHFKEFYCPLNVPCIHKADFVAHMTEMRLSDLMAQLGLTNEDLDDPKSSGDGQRDYLREAVLRIRSESTRAKAEGGKPLKGEIEAADVAEGDPVFRYLECYFQFDARQTGRTQRIFLTLAYDFDIPIFWDYIQNVTPEGRYPFEVTRLIDEDGRWYGVSFFKKYGSFQDLIDKLFNQIIYRNDLAANPVKFRRREAVVQWQDDQPLEIGPDKVFDLNDGFSADDALQSVEIPQLDSQTRYVFETVVANWRTRSGISTATQGGAGEMPAEKTATGVTHIAQSGATMFAPMSMNAKRGLEATLQQAVAYQYAYQDVDETFTYLEGDAQMVGRLDARSIRGLKFDVKLTLNQMRQTQNLEKSQLAIQMYERFLGVPPEYQSAAVGLFEEVFKNLGIEDPGRYFEPVIERNEAAAAAAAQQEAMIANVEGEAGADAGAGGPAESAFAGIEGGAGAAG